MGMADSSLEDAWRRHHPYLVNLAYQMLGDIGDAEDVAQETFLRLSRTEGIDDVRAWLTVVAGRLCLDHVRSARHRYESAAGETILEQRASLGQSLDPADRVTLDNQVGDALLQVLRRLSPGERVAFVLHDVFKVPIAEIAETVGRPIGSCRQLARRARAKGSGSKSAAQRRHSRRTPRGDRAVHHGLCHRGFHAVDRRTGFDGLGCRDLAGRSASTNADQLRPRSGRDEPAAACRSGRDARLRADRAAGATRVRGAAAVRRACAERARRPGHKDRSDGGPVSAWVDRHEIGRNFYDSGSFSLMPSPLAILAAFFDRLGHHEPATTICGFAVTPLTRKAFPEITTAITHVREVLGDDVYRSFARTGENMTNAAMATFAFEQIDQARAELLRAG